MHEALAWVRWQTRFVEIDAMPEPERHHPLWAAEKGPEAQAVSRNLQSVLETAITALPDLYRPVVLLRDVQGLSTRRKYDDVSDLSPAQLRCVTVLTVGSTYYSDLTKPTSA